MSDASLVSISEAEMVQAARSYPDLFQNLVDLVVMKKIALTPTQRKQLTTIAKNQWQAGADSHLHSQDIAVSAHSKIGLPGQLTKDGGMGKQFFLAEKDLRKNVVPSYTRKDIKHATDFASKADKKVQAFMKKNNITDFGDAQRMMKGGGGNKPPQKSNPNVVKEETRNIQPSGKTYSALPSPSMQGQIATSNDGDRMIAVSGEQGLKWVDEGKLHETNNPLWKKLTGWGID